jgi:hypothetical protein
MQDMNNHVRIAAGVFGGTSEIPLLTFQKFFIGHPHANIHLQASPSSSMFRFSDFSSEAAEPDRQGTPEVSPFE